MEIFSFISLALSIFGSALAAFAGLRSHYEKGIFTARNESENKVTIVAAKGQKSKAAADGKAKKLRGWATVWSWCQWIPVALFSCLTLIVAFYVCVLADVDANGEFASSKLPVSKVRWEIGIFFVLNMICFGLALRARFLVKALDENLDELVSVAKDKSNPDVV